jgi:shikimate dehydrogenase
MTPRYAIFGQPIAHSLSPRIHALFAAQFGIALDYRAIETGRSDFVATLKAFADDGGRGANVTLPLKEDACASCSTVSDRARRARSVNTLVRDGDAWHGDSTDGEGFVRDMESRHGFALRDRACLVLGAGGAARAVAFAIADAGAARIAIANRTHASAVALVDALGANTDALAWDAQANMGAFDVVVHATAAGHDDGSIAWPSSLAQRAFCYDLSYGSAAAPFVRWAHEAGAERVADGLGMLVEQAAASFAIWHSRTPDTAPVYAALRRERPLS